MVTDVRAARLLVAEAGRLKDGGDAATIMATWIAKYFASTAAARHASEAVQIHGANGCSPDFPVGALLPGRQSHGDHRGQHRDPADHDRCRGLPEMGEET